MAASQTSKPAEKDGPGLGPVGVLVMSVWFGLVAGMLELGVLAAQDVMLHEVTVQSIRTNRHYAWMIPISDAAMFAAVGLPLALVAWREQGSRPGGSRRSWRSRRGRPAPGRPRALPDRRRGPRAGDRVAGRPGVLVPRGEGPSTDPGEPARPDRHGGPAGRLQGRAARARFATRRSPTCPTTRPTCS